MRKKLPLFQAIATLVGTIIGAGILGLPYVFAQAGFLTASIVLVVITFAMVMMKLMFGELTLRTYGKHQISGYVEKYLGSFWKKLTSFILVLTITGSLLAYFVGVGEVLAEVLPGSPLFWGLIFYGLGSILLYVGIGLIKSTEFILTSVIFFIALIILFLSRQHLNFDGLAAFNLSKFFIPYGVILFACSGLMAVPEVRQVLFRREYLFKKAVFWGALIPSLVYLLFAWVVVSVSGQNITEVATVGLGRVLGRQIIIVGNVFAFFTMATSFLTLGLGLKQTFNFDFKIRHFWAWLLTVAGPLIVYFLGLHDFIKILSLVGALGFGINGVIYIFAYWSARRRGAREPEYVLPYIFTLITSIFLVLVFVGGLVYTIAGLGG